MFSFTKTAVVVAVVVVNMVSYPDPDVMAGSGYAGRILIRFQNTVERKKMINSIS